ncbi:hypothetical protein ACQKMV_09295 [Lysinibacillus sp. NPDC094403]|uniref:hypothetical protein n=1 Tax=Lysinibacillus sp. NPDC094403 TaxID=3390581 RepID=UPI003CFF9980
MSKATERRAEATERRAKVTERRAKVTDSEQSNGRRPQESVHSERKSTPVMVISNISLIEVDKKGVKVCLVYIGF